MPRSRRQQFCDARLPFGRVLRVARMQIVVAAPSVRVDEQQTLVLACECTQDFEQQNVLVHVGKIAGVILVAVLHATPTPEVATLYTLPGRRQTHPQVSGRTLTASASRCA